LLALNHQSLDDGAEISFHAERREHVADAA